MAGKKNQKLVAVIDGVTKTQAANIQADILKSKNKHAPHARATAAVGSRDDVGKLIGSSHDNVKKIGTKGGKSGGKKK